MCIRDSERPAARVANAHDPDLTLGVVDSVRDQVAAAMQDGDPDVAHRTQAGWFAQHRLVLQQLQHRVELAVEQARRQQPVGTPQRETARISAIAPGAMRNSKRGISVGAGSRGRSPR